VYESLHMQWMGIWNHRQPVTIALVDPEFDSRLKAWVTDGLQTIPLCSDKPIGAAPRWPPFFGGEGGLLAKKGVTLRGLRISEKKEILRKLTVVSVLIDSKLCTMQYCNITILLQYCTIL
jgi:hypothetical protein